jgi:hypothetical protein
MAAVPPDFGGSAAFFFHYLYIIGQKQQNLAS